MEHGKECDYGGGEGERKKRLVLRRERKRFLDRDKSLKVGEDGERVIFAIMGLWLTGAQVLRLEGRKFQRWDADCGDAKGTVGEFKFGCKNWERKTEVLG